MTYKELDVVVAARNLPRQLEDEQDVPAGTMGAVVDVMGSGKKAAYEVEFIDGDGYTLALLVLQSDDIVPWVPQKEKAAAA